MENKMNIQEKIKDWIEETLKIEESFVLAHPKDIKNGDYSFFASPKLANEFGRALSENKIPEIEKVEVVGSFINFYLSKDFFAESVKEILDRGEECGQTNLLKDQKIIIEHTQPNPFKEFHIGHLMNNAIGESVSRILKSNGADTKSISYHGDVGLHVAKAVWGLHRSYIYKKREFEDNLFNDAINEKDLVKKIIEIGNGYFEGNNAFDKDQAVKEDILKINRIIYGEEVDTESGIIKRIYNWGRKVSLERFGLIYKRFGSHFDEKFFESETGEV